MGHGGTYIWSILASFLGHQVLGWASLVRPKRPTIIRQPTNKISLLCGAWRNLPLTADVKNFKKAYIWSILASLLAPHVLGKPSLVSSKQPLIISQPSNKISLLCGTWWNLPLTADITKLQKSQLLVNYGLIFGPLGTRLGHPGSSKTVYNNKSTHRQNLTSLRGKEELTFDWRYRKTSKKRTFGQFWPNF